jgi:type IV pilus assembly protein PilW
MRFPAKFRYRARGASAYRQAGMGLVELMVSMVLGLLVVGGVLGIFLSNQQVFKTNENLGRLQENARVSFELMAREMRQAGGNLCGAKVVGNVLNNATTAWSSNWSAGGIKGFDGTVVTAAVAIGTAANERVTGTDAVQILGSGWGKTATITAHDAATAQITLNPAAHGFSKGALVMVCDGVSAAIAQLSDVTGANVFHAAVVGDTPGNCAQGLGYPTSCAAPGTNKTMQVGGFVTEFSAGTWYIANNDRGGKSLYRKGTGSAEEIAEGVVDMQLTYLLKTVTTGVPDSTWSTATDITDWTPAAAKQVVAIRVKLTLETLGKIGTNQKPIARNLVYIVNLRNKLS